MSRQVFHVESGYGYGVVGADLHVFADRGPVYLLAEYRSTALPAGRRVPPGQPSRLLNSRYEVVDFTGREHERAALAGWRDTDEELSVLWLHGPGGQGKSRLAAQVATESAAAGWKVVTATHGPGTLVPSPGSHDVRPGPGARGLLLIVDYADRWPLTHLTWLLGNKLLDLPLPTRVLLLARSASAWPAVRGALEGGERWAETRDLALEPVEEGREAMFRTARDCFAARYGLRDPGAVEPPGPLDGPEFGLVLALHMAALVAVDAYTRADDLTPPQDMAGLSAYLLHREAAHWRRRYENHREGLDHPTPPGELRRAVFTAVLTGATPHADGVAALGRLGFGTESAGRLLDDHRACYPPGEPGAVLEPLYPDRLAEDFLALTLPGHPVGGEPGEPWARDAVRGLLARDPAGAAPGYAGRALTFLAAAATPRRWPHVAGVLAELLGADPALAVDAGGAALGALAEVELAAPVLEAVAGTLPELGQLDLDAGIAPFAERLSTVRLAAARTPRERALVLQELGFRLARAGRREEALTASRRAVEELRQTADPGADPAGLAAALGQLAEQAGRAGRRAESVRAAREAVALHRRLTRADPVMYEPELAVSLSQLGQGLLRQRRGREALATMERAVGTFQRLAASDPSEYEPALAISLGNLGALLWSHRRWADGRQAVERAVDILRQRMARGPAGGGLGRALTVEESDLAALLSNLAVMRWSAGQRPQGVAAAEESAGILRRAAEVNPAAFEPELARVLHDLSRFLPESGRWRDGLNAGDEAVTLYRRRLAQTAEDTTGPRPYEAELARSLRRSAWSRIHAGHEPAVARAAADEAIGYYRRLVGVRSSWFRDGLRDALKARQAAEDRAAGIPVEPAPRTWMAEEHWVVLLNQDDIWQDAQNNRYRLDSMSPAYCGNVARFVLRQADEIVHLLVEHLGIAPDALGLRQEERATVWLERQPLLVALRRRARGLDARPAHCHCGYPVQPDWHHEHCYPGIVVD
ncbi:hypothetical protein SUDANB171_03000 [Streptomyces sp. enrichment culture]|uniref:hypothetical protein n=1 Tax=Streptomyces sp. enrichment culture TaxID=1795815 RepID=UPI003F55527B